MKTHLWKWFGVLSGLALVGLLLAGIVTWQMQPRPAATELSASLAPARQDTGDGAPTQDVATALPADLAFMSPMPTPSPVGNRPPNAPPFCKFTGETTFETAVLPESLLDSFVFSEPTVVLTNAMAADILEWLPNSNQLLIARIDSDKPLRVIETWDAVTGEIRRLATQTFMGGRPIWVDSAGIVAYPETEILNQQTGEYRTNLWVSAPESDEVTETIQDLREWNFSISDSGEIVRFSQTTDVLEPLPETMRGAFREIVIPTELATLLYEKYLWEVPEGYRPKQFFVARSPDGRHLALYADPYLYLYDTSTQSLCEVVVGESTFRYPLKVQWSPDGQTLAMLTTDTPSSALVESPEIIVLNITSGEQKQLRLEGDPIGIAWGPDSRYLLVLSLLDSKQWRPVYKLFLIDTWTGKARLLFPEQVWGGGGSVRGPEIAWSPSGQEIVMKCPDWRPNNEGVVEDRLCLSHVKVDR
jgi:hypothetical protein